MSWALVERLHGHLAVLALALLLHPVASLPADRPWTRRTAALAATALVVPFALGLWMYPEFREQVRPALPPAARGAFEVKEHLAAVTTALAVAGAVATHGGPDARKLARDLLSLAFCSGAIAAVLGVWVATR